MLKPTTSTPDSARRRISFSTVTTAAPVRAPVTLNTPPMIAIVSTITTCGTKNEVGEKAVRSWAYRAPPMPAKALEKVPYFRTTPSSMP